MFVGTSTHTLDDKGRLVLPARWRQQLEEGAYVSKSLDGCLSVYRAEDFETWALELREKMKRGAVERGAVRSLSAGAGEVALDRQGRITIPPQLRSYAGLSEGVVVIGNLDHIEVWSAERWADADAAGSSSLINAGPGLEDLA
ncbi:division/cell wall cluster transcriptional repressor MraZ [soil metagenome]